jgi:hypothetical protein
MANLSQAQIEMLARSAGMANPQVMAAIAMAESGGNPRAHNPVPPDNSYGLWQINMLGSMGPSRRKQYGISSNEALFNPAVNAKAAAMIQKGQGLSAWSTYTNGAYKKYMGKGGGASQAIFDDWNDPFDLWPDDAGPAPESPWESLTGESPPESLAQAGAITDIAKLGVKAAEWMANPRNWLSVLYVATGGVVVIAALSATVRNQVVGQAKSIVGKVAKS